MDSYHDEAVGALSKNERGVPWVSSIVLNPRIVYGGEKTPSEEQEWQLHGLAHEQCYISNSIKTEVVVVRPVAARAG